MFDAVALLLENAVVDNRLLAVRVLGEDGLDFMSAQILLDGIGVASIVSEHGGWLDLRPRDQRIVYLAVGGLSASQMEGEWLRASIGDAFNVTAGLGFRTAKSLSMDLHLPPAVDTWAEPACKGPVSCLLSHAA